MKKIFIVCLINVLSLSISAGGVLSIENEDNIDRVANNVLSFWSEQKDLIPEVMAKKPLQEYSIEQIKNSRNSIARDFFRSKSNFLHDLDQTTSYVMSNRLLVLESIGDEQKAKSFANGLLLLKRLIDNCI